MILVIVVAVLQMPFRISSAARHRPNRQHGTTLTLFEIANQPGHDGVLLIEFSGINQGRYMGTIG
jgi:hypothetical protein